MGSFSLVHWLVFGAVAILLLGGGRFSNLMGDVAKGIKQFKRGMAEEDETARPAGRIEAQSAAKPAAETTLDAAAAERVREER